MGFENFGTVSFTAAAKVAEFLDYLEAGKVMASRCKQCGTAYFPPRVDCPRCINSEVEWFEVKGEGKLNSYTKVNYGPSGFEGDAPYTLALGEFDGVQILARLSRDIPEADYRVGMGLVVRPVKLPNDKIAYEFGRS